MVDGKGTPLACRVTAANVHDVKGLLPAVVACPLGRHGTAERLPKKLYGDRAYGSAAHERILRWMGVEPVFARRGAAHGSGLGKYRYVVEQTIAATHKNRRLKIRYEKRDDIHQAFLTLACIKICGYRLLQKRK